jgi:hypothetical protein
VVERVACPFETLLVPMDVSLSKKVTVPVSPEPVVGKTVAVSVTDCANGEGLSEVSRPRLVGALLTATGAVVADELARKSAPPSNEAVMESEPSASVVRSMLAVVTPPLVDRVEEPSVVPLSANVTVPVGSAAPDVGATVAVSVTLWP